MTERLTQRWFCGLIAFWLSCVVAQTTASRLLLSARRGAGLTQRALARRARTSQSVIARIESGAASPSWKTLQRLLNRAGFDLQGVLSPRPRGHSQTPVAGAARSACARLHGSRAGRASFQL